MAQEEHFQTYTADGRPQGLVPRSEVHRRGLWHKAAQIFVYRGTGELLLQQRALNKDLHPGCWDASVGEHLKPGETYLAGAQRGLREELSIEGVALTALGPEQRLALEGEHYRDYEMQMAFRTHYDGPLLPNDEIQTLKWVTRLKLKDLMADAETRFTPWFLHHYEIYTLFSDDS